MQRVLFFVIVGLGGAAILISLGVWQMQRLTWKQGIITDIEARIDAAPVALPDLIDPDRDAYLPVSVEGVLEESKLYVLVSSKELGPGYRIISPFSMDNGRRILADLGFVTSEQRYGHATTGFAELTGNLQWPQEVDSFTPEPDLKTNTWFARDVPAMAARFGAEPVLLVVRSGATEEKGILPMPVDTARIPNNHLQYAITWFSLAAIWLAMSLYFVRRRRADNNG